MTNEIVIQETESNQLQVSSQPAVPSLPVDFIKKSINFNGVEQASYMAKHRAPAFSQLDTSDRSVFVTAILYRVSVITGCPMPSATEDDDTELSVLEGELILLFSENVAYSSLNLEEVALAFRMNATEEAGESVKHWHQVFNIEYLSKVLRRYLDIRCRLEAKVEIEEQKLLPPPPAPTPEKDDQYTKEIIQYHYECFLQQCLSMDFIMDYEYDMLDKKLGLIQLSKADKDTLMGIGKERRLANLRGRAKSKSDFSSIAQLAADFANNVAPVSEKDAIVREAKRLAVWDFFQDLKDLGITNVFDVKNFDR